MRLINGRAIASSISADVAARSAVLRARGTVPTLAVVVPTKDEATAWYVRSIERAAGQAGIDCLVERLSNPSREQLTAALERLSADGAVHGVVCQAPLPEGMTLVQVSPGIEPAKDVDGANPASLGRLAAGLPTFAPATAAAVREVLRHEQVPLDGARVTVVGRSTVVGKPAALLLLGEGATVTVCHSRTRDLAEETARADVLVVAIGRVGLIEVRHIKPGAVVIDVGTNPLPDGTLAGDVNAEAACERAGAYTPVPGGIGPVTTALLLRQTLDAVGR